VADYRLRIRFAKTGAAIWLSHLEVVRAVERCVRRSGLPYAISQGFSPHMKHSFSTALPVGTGSTGEYMDVELVSFVGLEQALEALRLVQHEHLPILSVEYAPRDEPSLQVMFNHAVYCVELDDLDEEAVAELTRRLEVRPEITIRKKDKPKVYDLKQYLLEVGQGDGSGVSLGTGNLGQGDGAGVPLFGTKSGTPAPSPCPKFPVPSDTPEPSPRSHLYLGLLSRPEGSLRPEVIIKALAEPDLAPRITAITRIALEHQELLS